MDNQSSSPLNTQSDTTKDLYNSSFSSTSLDDIPNLPNSNGAQNFPLTAEDFEGLDNESDLDDLEDAESSSHHKESHSTKVQIQSDLYIEQNNQQTASNSNSQYETKSVHIQVQSSKNVNSPKNGSSSTSQSHPIPTANQTPPSAVTSQVEIESHTVLEVAQHYNRRPDLGVGRRRESRIFKLRSFNNWVKSLLIGCSVKKGDTVLDLGCGKGGDLMKFSRANASRYVGADLAAVSVEQAMTRYQQMKGAKFDAKFFVHDCFGKSTSSIFPAHFQADVVSLQFCLHYSFESEEKARMMLSNVTNNLKINGKFIGTIPNAYRIVKKLRSAEGLKFGNSIYNIRFENRDEFTPFGSKYWFHLEDAIDDCPEYLVHIGTFVKLASEYGLRLVETFGFHEYYEHYCKQPDFNDLLYRMDVISSEGPDAFPQDEWEAIGLYQTFIMEKIQ